MTGWVYLHAPSTLWLGLVCTAMHVHIDVDVHTNCTQYMCTHVHTCRDSQQMNTCWSTGEWGVGGGRGVSVGGVSQLRSDLSMWTTVLFWVPLLNETKTRGHVTNYVTIILYSPLNYWSEIPRVKISQYNRRWMSKRKILWWLNVEK